MITRALLPGCVLDDHRESRSSPRDCLPDLAKAHDAKSLAVDVPTNHDVDVDTLPVPRADVPITLDNAAARGEHQGPRCTCDGLRQHAGNIGCHDTAPFYLVKVEILVTGADGHDPPQSRTAREERTVDAVLRHDEGSVAVRAQLAKFIGCRSLVSRPPADVRNGGEPLDRATRHGSTRHCDAPPVRSCVVSGHSTC